MNCWWDVNLRSKWKIFLIVVYCCFLILAVYVPVVTGITVAELIAFVAANLRLVAWGTSELREQSAAIERINGIHLYLSNSYREKPISPCSGRHIQDEIFEHRCSNPPVPDWFYWWERDDQELEAAKP